MKIDARLTDDMPRVVYGFKGAKSRAFAKKFKNAAAMDKWFESDAASDVTVHAIEAVQ